MKKSGGKAVRYNKWGYIFLIPFIVVYVVFQLVPLITTIYNSFFENYMSGLTQVGPNFVGFENYEKLFTSGDIWQYFKNTMVLWIMCFSVFSCIVTAPFLLVGAKPMSVYQIVMLLLAGAAATGGQLSITKAYTKAPAKEISVFDYSQVIFAALLGFVFLQQIPDYLSVIGYVIIIGSAIFKWNYNLRQEEKV